MYSDEYDDIPMQEQQSENNEKEISIDAVIKLLKENEFYEIEEDDEDALDNYYTPLQTRMRLKIPIDVPEFNVALQYMGVKGFYKGHMIPMNPDNTAFVVKENEDGKYIQPLMKKSLLSDLEDMIHDDENFRNQMELLCKNDAKALLENDSFMTLAMTTSGISEHFSFILTFSGIHIAENVFTGRNYHIYVDNNLNDKELTDYITPYKEGVKSAYERTKIPLPGMLDCKNQEHFSDLRTSMQHYYRMCSKKNIVVDDPIKIKNFFDKTLERASIDKEYSIINISNNFISIRRIAKYLFGEYLNLQELCEKIKFKKTLRFTSYGEAEIISEIIPTLKQLIKAKELEEEEQKEYN